MLYGTTNSANSRVILITTLATLVLLLASCGGGTGTPQPTDNQPQAVDDTAVALFEVPLSINVLTNDSSADGIASISIASAPANGSAVVDDNGTVGNANDDVIVYTPNTGFFGNDSFSYIFTDSDGDTDTATVTVTVNEPLSICKTGIGLSAPSATCSLGMFVSICCLPCYKYPNNHLQIPQRQFQV